MTQKKFYSEGLRFECQGSGKCCTSRGAYGYVYLTRVDRKRFADFFKLSSVAFKREYCETTEGYLHLRNPDKNCEFLEGTRCGVYEARPEQCRTWPFWPENLRAKGWSKEVSSFCPGIGKGRLYSEVEIEAQLKSRPVEEA
ncbi:MAG: YkgJ family cysteine cluster protein [Cryobacterium sp.]|nr:YkgJ family cysteine cluster protein [Oligoflexia bacterium]